MVFDYSQQTALWLLSFPIWKKGIQQPFFSVFSDQVAPILKICLFTVDSYFFWKVHFASSVILSKHWFQNIDTFKIFVNLWLNQWHEFVLGITICPGIRTVFGLQFILQFCFCTVLYYTLHLCLPSLPSKEFDTKTSKRVASLINSHSQKVITRHPPPNLLE